MAKRQPDTLPQPLILRAPRTNERRGLAEPIARGEALARRETPADLRIDTPVAKALKNALQQWRRDGRAGVKASVGEPAAQALKAIALRYTTTGRARRPVQSLSPRGAAAASVGSGPGTVGTEKHSGGRGRCPGPRGTCRRRASAAPQGGQDPLTQGNYPQVPPPGFHDRGVATLVRRSGNVAGLFAATPKR